jgi:hypothetical protein
MKNQDRYLNVIIFIFVIVLFLAFLTIPGFAGEPFHL